MSKLVTISGQTELNFSKIQLLLNGGLGLDNFKGRTISGNTNATAHTQQLFKHQLQPMPLGGIVLLGNVYLYSIDANFVDVRSSQSKVLFTMILVS